MFFEFLIPPFTASLIPFIASLFFDSPDGHGLFSFDIFILCLFASLPSGHTYKKLFIAIAICLWGILEGTIESYLVSLPYLLMLLLMPLTRGRLQMAMFFLFTLLSVVADCGRFFYSTFVLTLPDVWGLAKFYWWGAVTYIFVPLTLSLLVTFCAKKLLKATPIKSFGHFVCFAAIALLVLFDTGAKYFYERNFVLDFPVKTWLWQLFTPGIVGENIYLQEDIKKHLPQWDLSKNPITDFAHPTVVVLVESYGINKSVPYTDSLLAPYQIKEASFVGMQFRRASFTQGAEWEDFGVTKDGKIEQIPIVQSFKNNGLQTWYLHGYDGFYYARQKDYPKFGFDSLLFHKEFERQGYADCKFGFEGICDSSIVAFMDSLLNDSIPKFIFWMTLDGHPPYEFATISQKSLACKSLELSEIDCLHITIQQNTARLIVELAKRHPNYRFVVRGDHRPMASIQDPRFVQSFYFRWVPMVVIN